MYQRPNMKRGVQALLSRQRRRAQAVPALFAGCAVLVILVIGFMLAAAFFSEAGQVALRGTPTPTITSTSTPMPPTATATQTLTPEATPTVTDTPGPTPTRGPQTYTVEAGDTLFGISAKFNVDFCLLITVNNITDPGSLGVGAQLIIPGDDTVLPSPTPLPELPRGARIKYTVQCGDTLDSIATQFNSTADDITKTNKLTTPVELQIGQVLDIRVNLVTPAPPP